MRVACAVCDCWVSEFPRQLAAMEPTEAGGAGVRQNPAKSGLKKTARCSPDLPPVCFVEITALFLAPACMVLTNLLLSLKSAY
jgi:hypothetical protein